MSEKKAVSFTIQARYQVAGEVEMTEEEFAQWCERIDSARGFERERVAQDLMDHAGLDYRDGDIDDDEIEDFNWA